LTNSCCSRRLIIAGEDPWSTHTVWGATLWCCWQYVESLCGRWESGTALLPAW